MTQIKPYSDDYLKASEYLRLALSFLSRHKIPACPLNFRIGYDYVSGNNTALKKALNELLEQPGEPAEKSLLEFYQRFFVEDGKALESLRLELQRIISNIQNEYEDSGGNLSGYSDSLNAFANILANSTQPGALTAEVQKVMEDTRSTEQYQRKFESQVSSKMSEVETLREQLEQVREESLTDALTGIANRKAFDTALEQTIEQAGEQESSFCVVIADIDHFKQFFFIRFYF